MIQDHKLMEGWFPISTCPVGVGVLVVFADGETCFAKFGGNATAQHNDLWDEDGLDFNYGMDTPIGWKNDPRIQNS